MNNLSKKFDEFFKRYGGKLHYESDDNGFYGKVIELGIESVNAVRKANSNLPLPYIDFIQNLSINAIAAKYNGDYFIGINAGSYMLINELFLRMLSSPNILTQWGDASKEIETKKIFNPLITNYNTYFIAKDPAENIIPKDKTRLILANLLTRNAMQFLFMHEYAHIIFGHVDYISSVTKQPSYSEKDSVVGINPFVLQSLEGDADAYGANIGIKDIELRIENIGTLPDFLKPFYKDFNDSLSLWAFSVYAMFRLFGVEIVNPDLFHTYSHPPMSVRQNTVMATIYTICGKFGAEYQNEIGELMIDAASKVEKAFDEISSGDIDKTGLVSSYHPKVLEHQIKISEGWSTVRPLLEPFAFKELAP